METKAGHQATDGLNNIFSQTGAREDGTSLVDHPKEDCHDLHGDVREEDGGLLEGSIQRGAGSEGTQRENYSFVNLNITKRNIIYQFSTLNKLTFLSKMRK